MGVGVGMGGLAGFNCKLGLEPELAAAVLWSRVQYGPSVRSRGGVSVVAS